MTKRKSNDMNLRLPLVIILGATGSGKTKLSLDLAKRFGGEIIGADSMQIYKALDIITAKATKEEMKIAPHHMIDVLDPNEVFTVLDYRNRAVPIIDNLLTQNKLPIVVGGTNYYIESLLWKILVEDTGSKRKFEPGVTSNNDHELTSEALHEKLKSLDSAMAERLHPNDKRKILRSLEVYNQKGKKHSEILKEQQESFGGSTQGGGLRYPNSIVFWLQCEQKILDERLDTRVDSMIKEGLVEELKQFHCSYNLKIFGDKKPDYTKGIFQTIGFKEFHKYLFCENEDEKEELLKESIEELKRVTRKYARKQCKWVRNRFLGRKDRDVPPVYGLPTDNVAEWDKNVTNPAINILENVISGQPCKYPKLEPVEIESSPSSQNKSYRCEVCDRIFVGNFQWNIHVKSSKHRKRVQSLHKKERLNLNKSESAETTIV